MTAFPLDLDTVVFAAAGHRRLFSGASLHLFDVDDTTTEVIEALRDAPSREAPIEALAGRHDTAVVDATLGELDRLIEAEVLAPRGAAPKPPGRDPGLAADGVASTDLWPIVTNSCNPNCAHCFGRAE